MTERSTTWVLKGENRASSVFDRVRIDAVNALGAIKGAIGDVVGVGKSLASFLADASMEAAKNERAYAALSASMGGAASGIAELTKQIERKTGADADGLTSTAAMLSAIGLTEAEIRAALPALQAWADVTGKEMTAGVRRLQSALERGKLAEEIRVFGAYLDEGAAMAATFGGQIRMLETELSNVKEALGASVTQSDDLRESLGLLVEVAREVEEEIVKMGPALGDLLAHALELSTYAGQGLVYVLQDLAVSLGSIAAVGGMLGSEGAAKFAQDMQELSDQVGTLNPRLEELRGKISAIRNATGDSGISLKPMSLDGAPTDVLRGRKARGGGESEGKRRLREAQEIRAAMANAEEDARRSLGEIERQLTSDVWVGWGGDVETAVRGVIAKYDELREQISDTKAFGFDTTKALALSSQAQTREIESVRKRFAEKASKDLAKEEKQIQGTAEDLAGSFGRTFRAAIDGDAEAIGAAIARLFVQLLSSFGGPVGAILGSFLGGIFHQGSGNVHGPRYAHSGLTGLGGDERMLIYRTPEAVVNDRGTAILGRDTIERANRGEPVWGPTPQVTMAITIDGSRIDHRDFRVRQVGEDMRRATRYSASEWARLQRGAGLAPGR